MDVMDDCFWFSIDNVKYFYVNVKYFMWVFDVFKVVDGKVLW